MRSTRPARQGRKNASKGKAKQRERVHESPLKSTPTCAGPASYPPRVAGYLMDIGRVFLDIALVLAGYVVHAPVKIPVTRLKTGILLLYFCYIYRGSCFPSFSAGY